MTIAIRPLHPVFVGEVSGVDAARPLAPDEVGAIEAGMDRYAVLVFREQRLTDEQQMAFTRHLGPIEDARGGNITKPQDRRLQVGDRHPAASGLQRLPRLDEDADPRAADVLEAGHVEEERGRGWQDKIEPLVQDRRALGIETPAEGNAAAPVPHLGDLDLECHGPAAGYASTTTAGCVLGSARPWIPGA